MESATRPDGSKDPYPMRWSLLVGAALCLGAGALGGYRFGGGHGDDHEEPAAMNDHQIELAEHLHEEEGTVHADPEMMERLGIETATLELSDQYVATRPLNALVEAPPRRHRTLHAPMGGRVIEVHVETGQTVAVGEPMVTLLRAPLPRPSLTITANLLTPAQESLHEAVRELRSRSLEVDILKGEIRRVQELQDGAPDGLPVVSPQRLVDLDYQVQRAETELLSAREEAEKHGLTEDQIAAVLEGEHGPRFDGSTWKAALTRNGLWTATADRLYGVLPEAVRTAPWSVATIGELVGSGLADDRLAKWLEEDASAADHFLELGVLLQRGHTLDELREMHALEAFEPVVVVRAPSIEGAEFFDVHVLRVQPGAAVEIGEALTDLHDFRQMRLRVEAVGQEAEILLSATIAGAPLRATPLIEGSGPLIEGVKLRYVEGRGTGLALVDNVLLNTSGSGEDAPRYRTWGLREGMRYLVHVPETSLENVFVIPRDAVLRQGAERVLFALHGDHFEMRPIKVLYEDESNVIARPSPSVELSAGDVVATAGAFELFQAANAGGGAVDPHAGHSH